MATVVVCDDDIVVRATISALCAGAGLEVVAETESGADAAEMVRRFAVDILVLDLSLTDGSGEKTLASLAAASAHAAVIVFTAYATDPAKLLGLGAREVIEKPDFERLSEALASLAASVERGDDQPDDRRTTNRTLGSNPSIWKSPAGLSSHHDLAFSLLSVEAGDVAVAVQVVGLEALLADVGPLLVADCRLAVAGVLADVLRVQDLLHEAPEVDGFIALMRGGDGRAPGAMWARLLAGVLEEGLPGELRGAAARVDGDGAKEAVARAISALQAAGAGSPSFVNV